MNNDNYKSGYSKLLLLIDDEWTREMVEDWVEETDEYECVGYDGTSSIMELEYDICIVDKTSFEKNRDKLHEKRLLEKPVLLPHLLVVQREEMDEVDTDIWDYVEDVVWADVDETLGSPVFGIELEGEIRSLLRLRDHTKELAEAREMYRRLVEQNLVGIYVIQDGEFTYVNPRAAEIFGYTREEITSGMSPYDLTHEDDHEKVSDHIHERMEGDKKDVNYSFKGVTKEGKNLDIEVHGARVDHNGKPAILGTLLDITERKEAERNLRESENKFRSIFNQAVEAIVIADDEGSYVDANPAAVELFGLPKEQLIGKSIDEFSEPGFDFETAWENFKRSKNERGECTLVRPNGVRRMVEYSASRNLESGLNLSVLRDITRRKKRERSLEVLNRVLRHDLRNDTNVILGNAELLMDVVEDDYARERIDTIIRKSNEMVNISDKAREIQKMLNHDELEGVNVDASDLVSKSIEISRRDHPGIRISANYVGRTRIRTHELMDSAVDNAIENAVEHNDKEVPEVEVSVIEEKECVEIKVADNGPGIPDTEIEILECGKETDLDHLSGLGLWIINWVVEESGGKVEFEPNQPYGSIVRMMLPKAEVEAGTEAEAVN